MKKLNLFLSLIIIASFIFSCGGGGETKKKDSGKLDPKVGFQVKGDKVTFAFSTEVYGGQLLDEIEGVTIAGEFNGWDTAAADWQATDKGDGFWVLEKTTTEAPCGAKFKYVVNQVDWMQPPTDIDAKYLTDDGFGGFNLVLACE